MFAPGETVGELFSSSHIRPPQISVDWTTAGCMFLVKTVTVVSGDHQPSVLAFTFHSC